MLQQQEQPRAAEKIFRKLIGEWKPPRGGYRPWTRSDRDEVYKMFDAAQQMRRQVLGSYLTTGNHKSEVKRALQLYSRVNARYEQSQWLYHPAALSNLGALYDSQGMPDAAEQVYLQALGDYEEALGHDSIPALKTVSTLGVLYSRQSKLEKAEQMHRRALAGYERAPGCDPTSILFAAGHLAQVYDRQGKFAEAEQMLLRALDGWEQLPEPDLTSTHTTYKNLITFYSAHSKFEEADRVDRRARAWIARQIDPSLRHRAQGSHNEAE